MKLRRFFSILLCVCMLLPLVSGCKQEPLPPESTVGSTAPSFEGSTAPSTEDTTQPVPDTVPSDPAQDPSEDTPTTEPTQDPTQSGTSQGGTSQGGTSQGGTSQGGPSQGGTSQGGTSQGGTSQGGTSQGGTSQGGTSQGGTSQGGTSQGGTSQGGTSQGGTSQGGTSQSTPSLKPDNGDGIYEVGTERLPYTEEQIYNQLFDLNNKIEIHLDMKPEELQKLQDDYDHYRSFGSKSPIYRLSDMLVTITTPSGATTYRIPEVGLRMKGNTSRTDFYNSHDGIYKYIHFKLDFQETFDDADYYGRDAKTWSSTDARKVRKNRTFATLEKLELRWNKCYDATYLREAYAYELYREQGVLAPRASICSIDWSDLHMGVYTISEPIDEIFLAKNLAAGDLGGDLYKCGWTNVGASFTNLDSIGIEDEDKGKFYIYDLKTNKKTSSHQSLKNLINKLNGSSVTKESFASLVDTDYFVTFAAVSYFLGNPDDLRNNYNNFYLYFLKSSGKAIFIPYDYDRCLGITRDYNPSGHAMTRDDPFSDRRESVNQSQNNPLYIYSVDKGGYYVKEYADALNKVAASKLLKPETFEQRFNLAKKNYGSLVTPGKTLRNAEGRNFSFDLNRTGSASSGDNMSFKDYITAKLSSFRGYMANLDKILNAKPQQAARYYLRGNFNDWTNRDDYIMIEQGEVFIFNLSFSHDITFKVYDNAEKVWYGVEALTEETNANYTTDNHGNLKLPAGKHKITFDPETGSITLEKK